MTVKSVTMISWELAPFYTRGGTAYAIRRLANQLTEIGIETTVLLPDWSDTRRGNDPMLVPLKMRADVRRIPRVLQCSEFCRVAIEAVDQIRASAPIDSVIAHSDEGAMFIILQNGKRSCGPSVFWLHSLYDPPVHDFSEEQRRLLPSRSLLASAVMMADIVVTSSGILKDAREFEWPGRLKELQQALTVASADGRVLTVESMGCLPEVPKTSNGVNRTSNLEKLGNVRSPYVLFPCRPSVDKGMGLLAAIAERLRADNIACVAVQQPQPQAESVEQPRSADIQWLPWLTQDELIVAMRNAACTVFPSLTEGFGLAAAESISQGVTTLYHEVGGHHSLQAFPNALPVPLTTSEKARLYDLWSQLLDADPNSWAVWSRHEISLRPLVDKWVEAIRSVVHRTGPTGGPKNGHFSEGPVEERWGNKLRRRIEVAVNV